MTICIISGGLMPEMKLAKLNLNVLVFYSIQFNFEIYLECKNCLPLKWNWIRWQMFSFWQMMKELIAILINKYIFKKCEINERFTIFCVLALFVYIDCRMY